MRLWEYILFAALGFFLGGILFSYHLPKLLRGVDVCAEKDHNPGAMNAFRQAGPRVGMLCLACDIGKGFLPVFWARHPLEPHPLFALVLAAPVLGHALAPLYPGKRGKAISVSFGALLGLVPESPLVWLLAALYLFFSLVWVIRPNERRTVVVFGLFSLGAFLGGFVSKRWDFALGSVLISLIVTARNLQDAQLPHRQLPRRRGQKET